MLKANWTCLKVDNVKMNDNDEQYDELYIPWELLMEGNRNADCLVDMCHYNPAFRKWLKDIVNRLPKEDN